MEPARRRCSPPRDRARTSGRRRHRRGGRRRHHREIARQLPLPNDAHPPSAPKPCHRDLQHPRCHADLRCQRRHRLSRLSAQHRVEPLAQRHQLLRRSSRRRLRSLPYRLLRRVGSLHFTRQCRRKRTRYRRRRCHPQRVDVLPNEVFDLLREVVVHRHPPTSYAPIAPATPPLNRPRRRRERSHAPRDQRAPRRRGRPAPDDLATLRALDPHVARRRHRTIRPGRHGGPRRWRRPTTRAGSLPCAGRRPLADHGPARLQPSRRSQV